MSKARLSSGFASNIVLTEIKRKQEVLMRELIKTLKKTLYLYNKKHFKRSIKKSGIFPTILKIVVNTLELLCLLPVFIITGPFYFFNEWSKEWFVPKHRDAEEVRELLKWKVIK